MDQAQHLDAERLAAFMDGTLSRAERAAVESHAADCVPCLQLLAAMVRTEPVEPVKKSWSLPVVLRWAVPIAVAATAWALWVNVDRSAPEADRQVAQSPAVDAVAPAPSGPNPPAPSAGPPQPVPQRNPAADNRSARASAPSEKATSEGAPQMAAPQMAAREEKRRDEIAAAPKQEAFGAKPLEAPLGGRLPAPVAPSPPPPPPNAPAAAPAPPAVADAAQSQSRARSAESIATLRRGITLPLEIVSPDSMIRWRVAGPGVQRSTDGGKTWGAPFEIAADLLAGSSPSPSVAWLAGRGGAVFRTTDGSQWQRLAFPESADLLQIRASSDLEAAVTLRDGRVFRTTDGGRSWSLQEP